MCSSDLFYTFAFDYSAAYGSCMSRANDLRKSGASRAAVELEYLTCVGARPANSTETVDESRDYFRDHLRESGVAEDDGICAEALLKRGFSVDENPHTAETDVSFNAIYQVCAFMHAFGSRATQDGYSRHKMADYLNGQRAVAAITGATAHIPVDKIAKLHGLGAEPDFAARRHPFP